MEKQNSNNQKSMIEIVSLTISIILFVCSLFPFDFLFIIGGAAFSFIMLAVIICLRKKFVVKNYFILSIIILSISFVTDIAFICYIKFMI